MADQFRQAEEALLDPEVRKQYEEEKADEQKRFKKFVGNQSIEERIKALVDS